MPPKGMPEDRLAKRKRELAAESKNSWEIGTANGSIHFRSPSSKAKMEDLSNRISNIETTKKAQSMASDSRAFERGDSGATTWYSSDEIKKVMKNKKPVKIKKK